MANINDVKQFTITNSRLQMKKYYEGTLPVFYKGMHFIRIE